MAHLVFWTSCIQHKSGKTFLTDHVPLDKY